MVNTMEYHGIPHGEYYKVSWFDWGDKGSRVSHGTVFGFQTLDNSTYPSFCIPAQWGLRSEFPGCQMALSEHSLPIPTVLFCRILIQWQFPFLSWYTTFNGI